MEMLGKILMGLGNLIAFIGNIWLLVMAGRQGCGWGLMAALVPFGNIVFIVKFWEEAKKPFSTILLGLSFMALGFVVSGTSAFDTIMAARRGGPPPVTQQELNSRFGEVAQAARELQEAQKAGGGQAAQAPAAAGGRSSGSSAVTVSVSGQEGEAGGAGHAEWGEAQALLRVSGFMKAGANVMARVNDKLYGLGETLTVSHRGREYEFRVKRMDRESNSIEFERVASRP
jgi:hypothetical protein